jgi:hypothetical protein
VKALRERVAELEYDLKVEQATVAELRQYFLQELVARQTNEACARIDSSIKALDQPEAVQVLRTRLEVVEREMAFVHHDLAFALSLGAQHASNTSKGDLSIQEVMSMTQELTDSAVTANTELHKQSTVLQGFLQQVDDTLQPVYPILCEQAGSQLPAVASTGDAQADLSYMAGIIDHLVQSSLAIAELEQQVDPDNGSPWFSFPWSSAEETAPTAA